jgi:hypothetical protein
MPCYRCGTRQGDPEPGKSSPWRRGVIREHQVLICPACQPAAAAELSRCTGCGSAHLVRRLDQVECLDCRLTRDADEADGAAAEADGARGGEATAGGDAGEGGGGGGLAAEVARALARVLGRA